MRDIPGYEGLYAVTADGRIWSYLSKRYLSPFDNGRGYLLVALYKNGKKKTKRINILVATAFDLPKPSVPTGTQLDVAHEDDNPSNNEVTNLFWKTRRDNLDTEHFREASKNRLRTKIRCVETGEVFESQAAAARAIGKHKYGINLCVRGKQNTCGGYHWERVLDELDTDEFDVEAFAADLPKFDF